MTIEFAAIDLCCTAMHFHIPAQLLTEAFHISHLLTITTHRHLQPAEICNTIQTFLKLCITNHAQPHPSHTDYFTLERLESSMHAGDSRNQAWTRSNPEPYALLASQLAPFSWQSGNHKTVPTLPHLRHPPRAPVSTVPCSP